MQRDLSRLDGIRPTVALLLLAVFLGAAQLLPATHLATHRDDHTHGPARPVGKAARVVGDADHAAAHRAGRAHGHDAPAAAADRGAPVSTDHDHDSPAADAPHDHGDAPAAPGEHGRASSAHFGLALLESPPSPFVPTPAESLAPASDDRAGSQHVAPALPQPPVRGPPRLS